MGQYRLINLEEARRLYFDECLSIDGVATRLGVSRSGIKHKFAAAGLKLRERGDARKLAYKRMGTPLPKGGRRLIDGYISILQPGHPRAVGRSGYVLEHILVWEKVHNRPLPKGWIIHHLNGIKTDNRPCNLVAMSKAGHTRREWGEALKKRIRELEAEVSILRRALENSQSIFYIDEN